MPKLKVGAQVWTVVNPRVTGSVVDVNEDRVRVRMDTVGWWGYEEEWFHEDMFISADEMLATTMMEE